MQRDNEAGSSRLSRYTRTCEIVANRKEAIDTCGGLTRLATFRRKIEALGCCRRIAQGMENCKVGQI